MKERNEVVSCPYPELCVCAFLIILFDIFDIFFDVDDNSVNYEIYDENAHNHHQLSFKKLNKCGLVKHWKFLL